MGELTIHPSKQTFQYPAKSKIMAYLLISPCRNEETYLEQSIKSVIAQSKLPDQWIIVDDGSTDSTPAILEKYSRLHPWIKIVHRENRGKRAVGPGVIEAFNFGLAQTNICDFEFLCKLDLDLELPSRYFEILIHQMIANPRLGSCSGKSYIKVGENLVNENKGDDTSLGMTKFYRTQCFLEIGGFVQEVMWDGIDCHRSRMMGWAACSWDKQEIRFVHLRPMGSSQDSIYAGRMRHGYGQYFMGTSLPYLIAASVSRVNETPKVVGSICTILGWIKSMLSNKKRYEDQHFRKFLQDYQKLVLLKGKGSAIEITHKKMGIPRIELSQYETKT